MSSMLIGFGTSRLRAAGGGVGRHHAPRTNCRERLSNLRRMWRFWSWARRGICGLGVCAVSITLAGEPERM